MKIVVSNPVLEENETAHATDHVLRQTQKSTVISITSLATMQGSALNPVHGPRH